MRSYLARRTQIMQALEAGVRVPPLRPRQKMPTPNLGAAAPAKKRRSSGLETSRDIWESAEQGRWRIADATNSGKKLPRQRRTIDDSAWHDDAESDMGYDQARKVTRQKLPNSSNRPLLHETLPQKQRRQEGSDRGDLNVRGALSIRTK